MEPATTGLMGLVTTFIQIILHLDVHLASWTQAWGLWTYLLLFLIVFAETGLVVTPFLPGDSLLFAAGAIATVDNAGLNVHLMAILLIAAGILGDFVNYTIGKNLGPKIFRKEDSWLLNKQHLLRTQNFYEQHGAKTIIIARFAPIIRTFAPFVAGIGKMNYSRFVVYNALGSVLWVTSFLYAGYFFGNLPAVKTNFHIIIFGVIGVSLLPVLIGWWQNRRSTLSK
jgi:membrane-associated protein